MTCICGPQSYTQTASGGIVCGGTATVTPDVILATGGVVCGATATVTVPQHMFDGFQAVYHLSESADGTSGEYVNSTGLGNGTGGADPYTPAQTTGVFYKAQYFDGNDYITLPSDNIKNTSAITISLWAKITGKYLERVFYSRGRDGWSIRLGHDLGNRLVGKVQVVGETNWKTYTVKSTATMEQDCWYHCALVWTPSTMKIYLDGELAGTKAVTETTLVDGTGSFVGRVNNDSYTIGNIQELRVIPQAQSADWINAEYETMCSATYTIT